MSPAPSDRPLRIVKIRLFEADATELERIYGHGWTTEVREIISKHLYRRRMSMLGKLGSPDE